MLKKTLITSILLFSLISTLSAQRLAIEILCHTDQVELYHNGVFVEYLNFESGQEHALYTTQVRFNRDQRQHQFVLVKEGYQSDTIQVKPRFDVQRLRYRVTLPQSEEIVDQFWDFDLVLNRWAFALPADKVIGGLVTFRSFPFLNWEIETLYGSDAQSLDYLLDRMPTAINQQLSKRGFDHPKPATLEAFFVDSLSAAAQQPKVILGARITDLLVGKVDDVSWGTQRHVESELTIEWYLFDPIAQKVVYQRSTSGRFYAWISKETPTMEQAFSKATQLAFDKLLFDDAFLREVNRLGEQALRIATEDLNEG